MEVVYLILGPTYIFFHFYWKCFLLFLYDYRTLPPTLHGKGNNNQQQYCVQIILLSNWMWMGPLEFISDNDCRLALIDVWAVVVSGEPTVEFISI